MASEREITYNIGWNAGYEAGLKAGMRGSDYAAFSGRKEPRAPSTPTKTARKASAYSKRYGKAFKRLAPKYKKKDGSWKKDGFKRCAAAARRAAKR